MFRGRKIWLAVQGWGSKKQKDLFCLKNNMQPLKDHDNGYFIHMWIRFPTLQSKFLVFFVLVWKMIMKICYIDSSTWENAINKKSAKAPGNWAKCKEVTGNKLAHSYWGLSQISVLFYSEYKAGNLQDHGQFPWSWLWRLPSSWYTLNFRTQITVSYRLSLMTIGSNLDVRESPLVVSNSFQSCELHSPWNSPGQNTGMGSLFFSRGFSQPRDGIQVFCIAGEIFTSWATKGRLKIDVKRGSSPHIIKINLICYLYKWRSFLYSLQCKHA